jgi:hypothetical protein
MESVKNNIETFLTSNMVANRVPARDQFHSEMNRTLSRFQQKVSTGFARNINLSRTMPQGNALIAAFVQNCKYVMNSTKQDANTLFQSVPVEYSNKEHNTSCSCATLRTCTLPAHFYEVNEPVYTVTGLVYGCYFLETVLLSSISCFYSESCIKDFRETMAEITYGMLSSGSDYPKGFSGSSTRFNLDDRIETLANEMFIESWATNVSYETFFQNCAPAFCWYTYNYRYDALELFTTFMSVYAGLSLGIHFAVPHRMMFMKRIRMRIFL